MCIIICGCIILYRMNECVIRVHTKYCPFNGKRSLFLDEISIFINFFLLKFIYNSMIHHFKFRAHQFHDNVDFISPRAIFLPEGVEWESFSIYVNDTKSVLVTIFLKCHFFFFISPVVFLILMKNYLAYKYMTYTVYTYTYLHRGVYGHFKIRSGTSMLLHFMWCIYFYFFMSTQILRTSYSNLAAMEFLLIAGTYFHPILTRFLFYFTKIQFLFTILYTELDEKCICLEMIRVFFPMFEHVYILFGRTSFQAQRILIENCIPALYLVR